MRFWLACCLFALLPLQWAMSAHATFVVEPATHEPRSGVTTETSSPASGAPTLATVVHCGLSCEPTCTDNCHASCCAVWHVFAQPIAAGAERWLKTQASQHTPPWPARPERPRWSAIPTPGAIA